MRKIFSEFINNYKTYTFSYAVYAVMEEKKDLSEIYENGYLPYSGSSDLVNHFYLCRSVRVKLDKFSLTSENKRIQKKHPSVYEKKIYKNWESIDSKLQRQLFSFYLEYFKNTHGAAVMKKERLEFVLSSSFLNRIVVYMLDEEIAGSILMVDDSKKENRHFWFSAFSEKLKHTGFGLWLMLDQIIESKENGFKYFYLGTGYGEKAKYKLQFEPLEYFNGEKWSQDISSIKQLLKSDSSEKDKDLLKSTTDFF